MLGHILQVDEGVVKHSGNTAHLTQNIHKKGQKRTFMRVRPHVICTPSLVPGTLSPVKPMFAYFVETESWRLHASTQQLLTRYRYVRADKNKHFDQQKALTGLILTGKNRWRSDIIELHLLSCVIEPAFVLGGPSTTGNMLTWTWLDGRLGSVLSRVFSGQTGPGHELIYH